VGQLETRVPSAAEAAPFQSKFKLTHYSIFTWQPNQDTRRSLRLGASYQKINFMAN
jgi:hypothetical protein